MALVVIGLLPLLFITGLQLRALITLPGQIAEIEAQYDSAPAVAASGAGEMAALLEPAPAPPMPKPEDPGQRLIGPDGKRLTDRDRRLVTSPDAPLRWRSVHVRFRLTPASLADPGEPVPAGVMREVFIEARSMRLAESLCGDVVETIARQCIVAKVNPGRVIDDATSRSHDTFELVAELSFVPSDPVGGVPGAAIVVVEDREPELFRTAPGRLSLDVQRAALGLALTEARAHCDRLRAQFGGCTIRRVITSPMTRPPAGVRARAAFLVLRLPGADEALEP